MLDLLAALLPCAWGYVYLAQELARGGLPRDQRYADWIGQYASEEFAEAKDWLRDELDRLAEGIGEEKKGRLSGLFLLSSRYEWLFWEMCWKGEAWPD
jgi:thiaminase/transcriptional activator TenA